MRQHAPMRASPLSCGEAASARGKPAALEQRPPASHWRVGDFPRFATNMARRRGHGPPGSPAGAMGSEQRQAKIWDGSRIALKPRHHLVAGPSQETYRMMQRITPGRRVQRRK